MQAAAAAAAQRLVSGKVREGTVFPSPSADSRTGWVSLGLGGKTGAPCRPGWVVGEVDMDPGGVRRYDLVRAACNAGGERSAVRPGPFPTV